MAEYNSLGAYKRITCYLKGISNEIITFFPNLWSDEMTHK